MLLSSGSSKKWSVETTRMMPTEFANSQVTIGSLCFEVPSLLVDCFSYVTSDGLSEGIFRVSGSVRKIREVTSDINNYKTWLESEQKRPSPHDVSGVIKLFLRDYTTSVNGLLPSSVAHSLKRLYVSEMRHNSVASSNSCLSVVSEASGASTRPSPKENRSLRGDLSLQRFVSSLARIILKENFVKKNELFIYLIHTLNGLLAYRDVTKMTSENLSIIFQPYIFPSNSISELLTFQEMLTSLIENKELLVVEYANNYAVLGGLEGTGVEVDVERDNGSASSFYSPSKASSTDYSSFQASPNHKPVTNLPESNVRISLSQKISHLWENYSQTFNKPKILSFMSRGSGKSSEDLNNAHPVCSRESNESLGSIGMFHCSVPIAKNGGEQFPYREVSRLQIGETEKLTASQSSRKDSAKSKRRLSLFGGRRACSPPQLRKDKIRSVTESRASMEANNNTLKVRSVDDLLLSLSQAELAPQKKPLMGRRLSLWIKKN